MFAPIDRCWICDGAELARFHRCRMEFSEYADQDRELHAYTGQHVWLVRCTRCGFGQPERLPTLPRFFDRMYDQRWAEDWVDREFEAHYKDFIFLGVLRALHARTTPSSRTLLDIGAHAGRFIHLAQRRGWTVEGVELNPRTATCAARRTGAPVYRLNAHALAGRARQYWAVTLTDVLEHIPNPIRILEVIRDLLEPGGTIAVKVPNGPGQWVKERTLAFLSSHRVSLAENLVHVNHFSPLSLEWALARAGFEQVTVRTGAPEMIPFRPASFRPAISNAMRLALYAAGRLPGAVHTPLALNLQAYGSVPRSASNP
jgi:2-polyprenyl-3-methyl-5-hydroxy-6-metoxy-1,4-benzoquinol methylase